MTHATDIKQDDHPTSSRATTQLSEIKKKLPLRVLTEEEFENWKRRGYVVVRNAVPQENIDRLKALLWEFEEKDPNDQSTWDGTARRAYSDANVTNLGFVEIYNHQFLWDNRMSERLYDAFVDIWDMEDLWVSIDRANLNTPNKGKRGSTGFVHWDADTLRDPLPVAVQGVLSLVHQDGGEMGGFQCIPWLFEHFDEWKKTQPADRDPHHPDMTGLEGKLETIELQPGDLMIFNSLLAHGIAPNRSDNKVRMAQYISMFPADEGDIVEREARIRSWRERVPPARAGYVGDPREWERKQGQTAKLTPLGEKLLGLKSWYN